MKNSECLRPIQKNIRTIESHFQRNRVIIYSNKNQIPDKILFFTQGMAYASNATGRYIYFKLPEGSYFGETHVLTGIPLSYSLFFDVEIGCSALVIKSEIFLKICKEYPNSFTKLIEKSENRRKLFRQYKFEVISQIIALTKKKFKDSKNKSLIRKMYSNLNRNKELNEITNYAK